MPAEAVFIQCLTKLFKAANYCIMIINIKNGGDTKKIISALLLLLITAACFTGNKAKSREEVYKEMEKEIAEMKYFKYTSQDSAYLSFYEGQSTNTFSVDKKGNSYSNRNGEHRYKVDGAVYLRSIVLKQEGVKAAVIMDTLSEDETDIGYFDRNTENVRNFLLSNMKAFSKLSSQKITTQGKGIKIEITNLKDTNYDLLDNIEIFYEPGKQITYLFSRTENLNGEQKKYTVTDKLALNSAEVIKLPELMQQGAILELKR